MKTLTTIRRSRQLPRILSHMFENETLTRRSMFIAALATSLAVLLTVPALGAPLVGSGVLPFPGATGDPIRQNYAAVGPAGGPWTGTWSPPANSAWVGTFPITGVLPHTPPVGAPSPGIGSYDFTAAGGYLPGALPVGTYFQFGDLDAGSGPGENFRLSAFNGSGQILTPWLEIPFAATATAVASDMPNYAFLGGSYQFDGSFVPGNPAISVFLKNNTAITRLEVARSSTLTAFILGAPLVPEPSSFLLLGFGTACMLGIGRRRAASGERADERARAAEAAC